jgi:5-methylcytosine-specific restriction protein A
MTGTGSTSGQYGADWRRLRAQVLAEEPFCTGWPDGVHGLRRVASVEVDHLVPKAQGGTDDRSNLRGSCRGCNRAKSRSDRPEYWRRG